VGQNIKILAAEPHQSNHDEYLGAYRKTGKSSIIGVGREVEGLRQDGSSFPMQLEIGEITFRDERLFLGVVRDISRQKEVERLKSEFVSTVSHELRTPLTSIRGSLGMVESGALTDPTKVATMIGLASKNTERLINLVNDLLDIDKLQADKMEFTLIDIDVAELVGKSIEINAPFATEFNVRYMISPDVDNGTVVGDAGRLIQVMSNLLSNAVKFSPPGGEVNISIDIYGPMIRISIEDDGPGISEEFHEKIFQRFSQGDSSDSRRKGGTGLGLSISQAIIEKHGGKIGLESKPGKGSMFFFHLPLKGKQIVDQSIISDPGAKTPLSRQINHDVTASVPNKMSNSVTPGEKRILHIEDDPDLCEIMAAMIGNKLHFETAPTVHFARQKIYSQLYDLIILDPGMPDGSALDLLEIITQTNNASTPVIIYSSSEIDKEIAAKVDRTLLKSKNSNEDLLLIIESLI